MASFVSTCCSLRMIWPFHSATLFLPALWISLKEIPLWMKWSSCISITKWCFLLLFFFTLCKPSCFISGTFRCEFLTTNLQGAVFPPVFWLLACWVFEWSCGKSMEWSLQTSHISDASSLVVEGVSGYSVVQRLLFYHMVQWGRESCPAVPASFEPN